jgi:FMN-dependent NADH-azoreductase
MSDDKLHDRLTRAARAQEIVESDLFKEATQTIERDLIAAWKLTPLRNTEDRERLWQAVQLIGKMSEFFLAAISDGKIAKRQLDELTPKPKKEWAEV